MDIINFSKIAAPKFEFGCGFYFCVIGALKYIIGKEKIEYGASENKNNQVGKNLVVFIYRLSSSSIFLSRLFIKLFRNEVRSFFLSFMVM